MHPSLFLLFPLALDLTLGHVTRPDTAPPMPWLTEPFSVGGTLELLVTVVPGQDPAGRDGLVLTSSGGGGGGEASCTHSFLSMSGFGRSCSGSALPWHDQARTSGLRDARPRQGVMGGRVVYSKTQSHWFPNGNKIL